MPYSFTVARGLILLLVFYTGLLPFVPLGESLLQFYLPHIFNRCVPYPHIQRCFLQYSLEHVRQMCHRHLWCIFFACVR